MKGDFTWQNPSQKRQVPNPNSVSRKKRRPFTVFLIVDDQTVRESLVEVLKAQKIEVQD